MVVTLRQFSKAASHLPSTFIQAPNGLSMKRSASKPCAMQLLTMSRRFVEDRGSLSPNGSSRR